MWIQVGVVLLGLSLSASKQDDAKKVEEKKEATVGTEIGNKIPHFTAKLLELKEKEPKTTDFDSHKAGKVTVYMFAGTKCPATAKYPARLRDLAKNYASKGVDFVFIYPNKTDTREEKIAYHKDNEFPMPMIDDLGGAIAKKLAGKTTSETLVVNKEGIILYRGAVDDNPADAAAVKQAYVAKALDEHLAGKPISTPTTKVRA